MNGFWDVLRLFLPAIPTLMAGAVGYFFARKSKQDRVINDLVIVEKLGEYKEREQSTTVDGHIQEAHRRLEESLKSLQRRSSTSTLDRIMITGFISSGFALILIAVIPPASGQEAYQSHPVLSWVAIMFLFIGAGLLVGGTLWIIYEAISAASLWGRSTVQRSRHQKSSK